MWVANVVLGLGLGPIYPAIYQMIESITPVTNLIGSLFIFTIGLLQVICPIIFGHYLTTLPMILIYINFTFICLAFILFLIIYFIIKFDINKG